MHYMRQETITLKDQLDFIGFMTDRTKDYSKVKGQLDRSDLGYHGIRGVRNKTESLEDIQKGHNPIITAKFLSLFTSPSGLKFLTHDFDPESDTTMGMVIEQANTILNSPEYHFKIPDSLYAVINGFINGKSRNNDGWNDNNWEKHLINLSSGELGDWIKQNQTLHPIASPEFGEEIEAFRNTIRVSKPNLNTLITSLTSNSPRFKGMKFTFNKLDKADFYTYVGWMREMIINKTLSDINQIDKNAGVEISCERNVWKEFRLHHIKLTHTGSEANSFEEFQEKLKSGGGALFQLAKACKGYCDWSVEANFDGDFKRWNILSSQDIPEIEELNESEVIGFTHTFTFYKSNGH